MANTYNIGDLVRVSTSTPFENADGVAFDPSVVRAKIKAPDDTITIYVYGVNSEPVRDGVGDYHVDVNVDDRGTWYYRIEGETATGNKRGADEGNFYVPPSEF